MPRKAVDLLIVVVITLWIGVFIFSIVVPGLRGDPTADLVLMAFCGALFGYRSKHHPEEAIRQ